MPEDLSAPGSLTPPATLFVVDDCAPCNKAILDVSWQLLTLQRQIVVRKPSAQEAALLPGLYPVLHLPKSGCPPVLLVGSGIRDVIRKNPALAGYNDVVP